MNKKTIWLALPFASVPAAILLFLVSMFTLSKVPFFDWLMLEATKGKGVFILIFLLFAYIFIAFGLCLTAIILGFMNNYNALTSAKNIMTIKIIQIPIHVVSFLLGAILFIMIFTFVIAILMAIINAIVILMMGLLNIVAIVNSVRQGLTKFKSVIWAIALQLVPCVDVVATIIFYIYLRKKTNQLEAQGQEEELLIGEETI